MSGHGITKCSCGKIISQCRCMDHRNVTTLPHPACLEYVRTQLPTRGGPGAWSDHRVVCAECRANPFSTTCAVGLEIQKLAASAERIFTSYESCPNSRDQRQRDVVQWTATTFGANTLAMDERASRFIEEALELVQATRLPIERVIALAHHVYAKPSGEVAQEIGAVGLTLLALSEVAKVSADDAEVAEMRRVFAIDPAHFRRRHNAKADAGVAMRVDEEKKT